MCWCDWLILLMYKTHVAPWWSDATNERDNDARIAFLGRTIPENCTRYVFDWTLSSCTDTVLGLVPCTDNGDKWRLLLLVNTMIRTSTCTDCIFNNRILSNQFGPSKYIWHIRYVINIYICIYIYPHGIFDESNPGQVLAYIHVQHHDEINPTQHTKWFRNLTILLRMRSVY